MDKTTRDTKILSHKIQKLIKNLILILKIIFKHTVKVVFGKRIVSMIHQISHIIRIHL